MHNVQHPHVTIQHIFYPEIKPILNNTNNGIQEFRLQGFHHDQYGPLEKSGMLRYSNPDPILCFCFSKNYIDYTA